MKIQCRTCRKSYEIPESRLQRFGTHVTFPCPACAAPIDIQHTSVNQPDKCGGEPPPVARGEVLRNRILRTVSELPPMPQVADKARRIVADEHSSFSDLARVIETDQAIAARVLKLANSSYYGVRGTISSIQHASVVLGMKTLNDLLILACTSSLLGPDLHGYSLQTGELWQHSLAVAGCARMLAAASFPDLTEDAFSAGLIHDCGKLILDRFILERKDMFNQFLKSGEASFLQAEKLLLGFDHAQIGAEVCDTWSIPRQITIAIQHHHTPSALHHNGLASIIHAADAIAMMSGIGVGSDGMLYQLDEGVMQRLNLTPDKISTCMAEAVNYVERTISALS
jgi:HD-like signal output (HDOD) protein